MACINFLSRECIDGNCPIALKESDDNNISDLAALIYEDITDCTTCYYNTFDCKDCVFKNSNLC